MHKTGKYVFVHAGIRPKKDLDSQKEDDLVWIRHDFLMDQRDYGFIVVHGHTPYEDCPHFKHNRINVDSGCFYTGVLTAVVLGGPNEKFLQAIGEPAIRWR
jgi:serine/threonine protein phosphatase 1